MAGARRLRALTGRERKMGGMHIVNTGDGSHTVTSRFSGEHYHSTHGAVGESLHVFLQHGLDMRSVRARRSGCWKWDSARDSMRY